MNSEIRWVVTICGAICCMLSFLAAFGTRERPDADNRFIFLLMLTLALFAGTFTVAWWTSKKS